MFSKLDLSLFRFLNGLAGRSTAGDAVVIFGATYLIFVMIALLACYVAVAWKTSHFEGRVENLTHALWAATIGFLAETLIGFLWFRPRPFAALEGVRKLVDRLPTEKSFPSAHATIAFALAFVHYPSDVLGGALVGLAAAALAAPAKKAIEPYLELFSVFRDNKRKV